VSFQEQSKKLDVDFTNANSSSINEDATKGKNKMFLK